MEIILQSATLLSLILRANVNIIFAKCYYHTVFKQIIKNNNKRAYVRVYVDDIPIQKQNKTKRIKVTKKVVGFFFGWLVLKRSD